MIEPEEKRIVIMSAGTELAIYQWGGRNQLQSEDDATDCARRLLDLLAKMRLGLWPKRHLDR